jgi:hypothetical protein
MFQPSAGELEALQLEQYLSSSDRYHIILWLSANNFPQNRQLFQNVRR